MRLKRKNQILVLLALLVTVFAPQEVERVRGGFAAGSTQRINCVHALFPALELEWQTPIPPPSRTAVYSTDSSGGLDEIFYQTCTTSGASFARPAPHPVLPPCLLIAAAPTPNRVVSRSVEPRGPPLPRVTPAPLSPRAPPSV